MSELLGIHQRVGDIVYIFGEIIEIARGTDSFTIAKVKSSYFNKSKCADAFVINTIMFWDEPERILGNGTKIREKNLSTQISKSKVGDKLLFKCYAYDDGRIKALQIGYTRSCFPYTYNERQHNIVYGKATNCRMGNDGRYRFTIFCNSLIEGKYENIFLNITVDCSEQFNQLAYRAEKCIQNDRLVLCNVADIIPSCYKTQSGEIKVNYSTWLSKFKVIF